MQRIQLETCSREELVEKVVQLEAHVQQLKNVISKQKGSGSICKRMEKKKNRIFNFRRFKKRHIVLRILYLGWDYQGFVVQEDTSATVEAELFSALIKTKLIESRESSNYHRCGRTDKGVSALSQAVSLDVRTNVLEGKGVFVPDDYIPGETKEGQVELDFPKILNHVLPPEIRVIAWAPVETNFSARFDCQSRAYRYYFPKGNLCIEAMRKATTYLLGEHDFRNLCKMDVSNGVVNYRRKIISASIVPITKEEDTASGYQLFELALEGQAFLWHQIRCIVAVLFLIGQGKEPPDIISQLLNVEANPCKPQYSMASELPLVLFDCSFEKDVEWNYDRQNLAFLTKSLQQQWTLSTMKSVIIRRMLKSIEDSPMDHPVSICSQASILERGVKSNVYRPLLSRPTCESLEGRIERANKKRKLF